MRLLAVGPLLLLAACPAPPDDSCFVDGEPTDVLVTLAPDRDDIETSELVVTLADCLDSRTTGTGAAGATVTLAAPSLGELEVTVTGSWAITGGDTAGEGGTCTGAATVDPEAGVDAAVTVALTCTTEWAD